MCSAVYPQLKKGVYNYARMNCCKLACFMFLFKNAPSLLNALKVPLPEQAYIYFYCEPLRELKSHYKQKPEFFKT